MAHQVVAVRLGLEIRQLRRLDPARHAAAADEGVEMAVLARPVLLVVGVVIPLGMAVGIEHVALGVVIEKVERPLVPEHHPDHGVAGLGQMRRHSSTSRPASSIAASVAAGR